MPEQTQILSDLSYSADFFSSLNWLRGEDGSEAAARRNDLLTALAGRVQMRFNRNKLTIGHLSPGCVACGEGSWSCIGMNALCTADCFFCPLNLEKGHDNPPIAEGIIFDSPVDYAAYVKEFAFRGVAFTGGEPLLAFDRIISTLRLLEKNPGPKPYIWMYTNGDLLDRTKLIALSEAGLDEIRVNIAARAYRLTAVELSRTIMKTVSVEIPAIPEDVEIVKKCMRKLEDAGVSHLNLHQLSTTRYNSRSFVQKGYTCLRYPPNYPPPILESETAALELIGYALDTGITMPVNYCSQSYKYRVQNRATRRRAAGRSKTLYESITEAGFIRKISFSGADISYTVARLKAVDGQQRQWRWIERSKELLVHPSLLQHVIPVCCPLLLVYEDVRLYSQGQNEILLDTGKKIFIQRRLVEQIELDPAMADFYCTALLENRQLQDVLPEQVRKNKAPLVRRIGSCEYTACDFPPLL